MGRRTYGDGTKGAALAALLAGNTPSRVAEEHGIPPNTVKSWRRRLKRGEIATLHPKKRRGDILDEYIESALRSLVAQSSIIQDQEWIHRQSAGGLALLYGIVFDRSIRSLELLSSVTGDGTANLRGRVHR